MKKQSVPMVCDVLSIKLLFRGATGFCAIVEIYDHEVLFYTSGKIISLK